MPRWLDGIQKRRAIAKVNRIRSCLPEPAHQLKVLDLGAGEGFVGLALQEEFGCSVTLADVLPLNKTTLDHVLYDGQILPFFG